MESLYRKYRPQTFEQVVGQSHVVSTLERAVTEDRTSHAYLFCGPRGTGKTTMARIVAKALMCEQGAGHLPDGTCEECQLIAAGEHPDVYELDAASRTGVDNVREEIISRVDYAPVRGRYKVYIIDEVHMLTPAAFNALLKTLEEPPEHVVFIMCTTDPQKILATILSRVQRFDFHSIAPNEMYDHLVEVCGSEGFTYDEEALQIVVRHARGGMRDALSALEQLSVFGAGHIGADSARDLLGEAGGSALSGVSRSLAGRDVPALFSGVAELVNNGGDLLQFTRELAARVRNCYVVSVAGAKPGVVDVPEGELAELAEEAAAYGSSDRLARVLTVLGDAASEMRTAVNQRLVLEIALTRCARPEGDLTLEALAERVERLERGGVVAAPSGAAVAAGAPAAAGSAPAASAAAPSAPAVPASAPANAAPAGAAAPAAGSKNGGFVPPKLVLPGKRRPGVASMPAPAAAPAAAAPKPVAPQAAPSSAAPSPASSAATQPAAVPAGPQGQAAPSAAAPSAAASDAPASAAPAGQPSSTPAAAKPVQAAQAPADEGAPAAAAASDPGALQRAWKQIDQAVRAANPSFGSLLLNAEAASDDGSTLTLSFPAGSAFAMKMLGRADVRAAVDAAVTQVLGPRKLETTERAAAPVAPQRPAAGALNIPEPATLAAPSPAAASKATETKPAAAAPAPQPSPAPAAPAPQTAPASSSGAPAAEPAPAPSAPQASSGAAFAAAPATTVPAAPELAPEAPADDPAEGAYDDEPPYDDYAPYDEADAAADDLPPIDVPDEPVPAPASVAPRPSAAAPAPSADAAPKTAAANLKVPDAADTDAAAPFTGGADELRSLAMGVWGSGVNVTVVSDDSE